MSGGRKWYLVHAKTRQEDVAERHLANQGYETFLPTELRRVRHARKTRTVRAAFFPGYLFVELDPSVQMWRPINSTVGVLRLVTADHRPMPAPPGLVEGLKAACGTDGHLVLRPDLCEGDQARIRKGPFTDLIGTVSQLSGPDRVRVLLEVMSAVVPVELPVSDCVRVS